MEKEGVIVRQEEPTEWVNSLVEVKKPNRSIRLCIDPRDLNNTMKRSHYLMKMVDEVVSRLQEATTFSILDAKQGFWQLKLDDESSRLCTFNTPIGRYRFTRLPFTRKRARVLCIYRFNKRFAWSFFHSHNIINIPRLLGLYGENIGSPGLCSRDRAATSQSVY